jgi:hypothetical protein
VKEPVFFLDRKIVDAGVAEFHEPGRDELPVLIPVGAVPLTGVVVRLIGKAHGNPIALEGPDLLDEPVIQFLVPLSREKGENFSPAVKKLRAVAPITVLGVSTRDLFRVAGIPFVLDDANLQNRRPLL